MDRGSPKTLYDKIFEEHVVSRLPGGMCVLYIDRHLVEDHASPQAFDGLRSRGMRVRAPEKTLAVVDHNVPTTDRSMGIDNEARRNRRCPSSSTASRRH
jgi:3-isopropylmalate/(R)-2-methylmalate dehydratase large subunit